MLEILVDVDHVRHEVGQRHAADAVSILHVDVEVIELRVGCGLLQNSLCRRGVRQEALVRFPGLEAGFARRVVAS